MPLKKIAESLSNKITWGRQSNALERSLRTAATYWFFSRAFRQSSNNLRRVVWHPWPLLKAQKKAQVTPLYKKNDPLLKTNYRPVSVLCIFSKIFEKILEQQLSDFFENIFNPYLCAFRRPVGYPFLDVRPTAQDTINFNLLFPIW
jgi:hypothetical protein